MTIVEPTTRIGHEWRLVAPWWHRPAKATVAAAPDPAAVLADLRRQAPVIQKYDSPDVVNTFLRDPQLRLQYLRNSDEVVDVSVTKGWPTASPTGVRKLFLGSHHRHYLVVCSLHCDAPAFPRVTRDAVCEAGFVVRRRTTSVPASQLAASRRLLRMVTETRRHREAAEAQLAVARQATSIGAARLTALEGRFTGARNVELQAQAQLREWAADAGVSRGLEGWVPHGLDGDEQVVPAPACGQPAGDPTPPPTPLAGVGRWLGVTELAETVAEATFPLHPLVPDPRDEAHDGSGESVWFGVVPTGGSDVDLDGCPRFDDRGVYEIRCFVRRHKPACPADGPHCHCPVTWSEPTAAYQLASHFDLEGTANRPVTVQMPDLNRLKADALRLGPGGGGGVRFQSPPRSALNFSASGVVATKKPSNADFQICSFSIPLLTIVALFVFNIFMPILVMVFQLWYLLLLKFCIPPEVSIGGGLTAALDAMGPGIEIDATLAASIADPNGPLKTQVDAVLAPLTGFRPPSGAPANGLRQLLRNAVASSGSDALDARGFAGIVRSAATKQAPPPPDRVFAPKVKRGEVAQP